MQNILLASIFNFTAIKNEIQFPISRKRKDGDTHPTGITHTCPFYWSHTHPTSLLPILLVTNPSYWSHTHLNTHKSYWLQTNPTDPIPIPLITHPSYWSHLCDWSRTLIGLLLVTHPFYWSHRATGHAH